MGVLLAIIGLENNFQSFLECLFYTGFTVISLNIGFGCSKNHLTETVLLDTHNICLG